jgi:hypothetical protein
MTDRGLIPGRGKGFSYNLLSPDYPIGARKLINTLRVQNAELFVKAGGTYSYHLALRVK